MTVPTTTTFLKKVAGDKAASTHEPAARKSNYSFRRPGESFVDFWLRFSKPSAGNGQAKDHDR